MFARGATSENKMLTFLILGLASAWHDIRCEDACAIAEQQLLRAQTEVKIAEQEALRYDTLNKSLDDQVLYKLFLDKWDGKTEVVPGLPNSSGGGIPPVIVGRK